LKIGPQVITGIRNRKQKILTAAQVVSEHVTVAISSDAYQACVWSTEVEGQIRGHQQPPYNHSTGQRSASGGPRGHYRREIPGIISKQHHTALEHYYCTVLNTQNNKNMDNKYLTTASL